MFIRYALPSGQLSSARTPRSIRRLTLSTFSPASSIAGRILCSVNGALLRLLKYGDGFVVWQPSPGQYAPGSKPNANAAVTDMHSTRNGIVQASAYACTCGPTFASRTACTRWKSPSPITGWSTGKRTWMTCSAGMPRRLA